MAVEVSGQRRKYSVGEIVELEVSAKTGLGSFEDVRWTIPGTIIRNYNGDATRGVKVTPLPGDQRTGQRITFAWVDGGDGRTVQADFTFCPVGKPPETGTMSFTCDVIRPTVVSCPITMGPVHMVNWKGTPSLALGNNQPGHAKGFQFDAVVQSPAFAGKLKTVQLINAAAMKTDKHRMNWIKQPPSSSQFDLDVSNPYIAEIEIGAGSSATLFHEDSTAFKVRAGAAPSPPRKRGDPIGRPENFRIARDDRFKVWIMFRPEMSDARTLWVPLATMRWSWAGAATWQEAAAQAGAPEIETWVINNARADHTPMRDTLEFPEWAGVSTEIKKWLPN